MWTSNCKKQRKTSFSKMSPNVIKALEAAWVLVSYFLKPV
jgi:hypothetical protein